MVYPNGFLADRMLGKLARYLRFLGHDVAFAPEGDDSLLLARARAEGRTILTRDRGLAFQWPQDGGLRVILLSAEKASEQLEELASRGVLPPPGTPRCTHCNHPLELMPQTLARHLVFPYTASTAETFHHCPSCNHVYWRGSHPDLFLQGPAKPIAGIKYQLR
jgi:uncharacterized protein with PIN domain